MARTFDTYDKLLAGIGVTIVGLLAGMALSSFALAFVAAVSGLALTGLALFATGLGTSTQRRASTE